MDVLIALHRPIGHVQEVLQQLQILVLRYVEMVIL